MRKIKIFSEGAHRDAPRWILIRVDLPVPAGDMTAMRRLKYNTCDEAIVPAGDMTVKRRLKNKTCDEAGVTAGVMAAKRRLNQGIISFIIIPIMKFTRVFLFFILMIVLSATACQAQNTPASSSGLIVLAAESFLADIAQNVAGGRLKVDTLMPLGLDPHSFEPTPRDITRIADCQLLIINSGGMEGWLQGIINNVGGENKIIEASAGLTAVNGDPHFWLDPINVIQYVNNIRDGLTALDPQGRDVYATNAGAYIIQLKQLDTWIIDQVGKIQPDQRKLVTNHETFGYFAARYGFIVSGSIIPSFSTDAAPSAQELIQLIDVIRAQRIKAIFLETGSNRQLADQIAADTGVKVISGLYDHSLSALDGHAPNYIAMMKFNVQMIVNALQ